MSKLIQQSKEILIKMKFFSFEEKVVQISQLTTAIGCLLPWLTHNSITSGENSFTALQYTTSYIGLAILCITLFIIALVLVPTVTNKNIIKLQYRQYVRFHMSAVATILILAILSVFTQLTWESAQISIRFGVYVSLIGSLVSTVYTWQIWFKNVSTYTRPPLVTDEKTIEPMSSVSQSTPTVESHSPLRK